MLKLASTSEDSRVFTTIFFSNKLFEAIMRKTLPFCQKTFPFFKIKERNKNLFERQKLI